MKKLYRSKKDRVLAGLIGGIGEYFTVSSVLLRFLFVIALIFSGVWPMVVIYVIGCFMIPDALDSEVVKSEDIHEA